MLQSISSYFNPYYDRDFFGFFWVFIQRIWKLITGQLAFGEIVSDEIQIFVLVGVSCSAALVGTFLVLKKMTMLANSISHTILVGIVIAFILTKRGFLGVSEDHDAINIELMLVASLIMGVITALMTEFLTKTVRLQEDASTGLVFTTLFAVGIIMVTILTRNAHIGAEVVMGNVDALHFDDIKLIGFILVVNVILVTLLYKEYKITTFDPGLARALGYSTTFFNYLLMIQVSGTVVGAFRAVGVLMVLCFITGPALIARLLTHNLRTMLLLSVCIGAGSSILGVALSRHVLTVNGIALSTAGVVVCTITTCYVVAVIFAPERGLLNHWLHKRKLSARRGSLN
ncbi:MAG: metal ABC transporter permease [Chlamydiota bacterium]